MSGSQSLHEMLLSLLDRGQWLDQRHLKTAVNMVVGLMLSGSVNVPNWIASTVGRAVQAQSVQRRFARWLHNERINVCDGYAPLIEEALASWGKSTLYLALDTTMLWDQYCMIRLSVIYRGRAVPLVWQVLEHGSAQVALTHYRVLLHRAAALIPEGIGKVVLLADRGFADVGLLRLCQHLGWRYRIRIKRNFLVYRGDRDPVNVRQWLPQHKGQAVFLHNVHLTAQRYGPVHLALAQPHNDEDPWLIVSDELTGMQTLEEYGLRFEIEESFLDDKSNGFQLEASKLDSAAALERLFFGIAVATLYLVIQGCEVVAQGQRRVVDPHWFRGSSYLKIGWQWLKQALHKGWQLIQHWRLVGGDDPEPAMASRWQYELSQQRFQRFTCKTINYAT